MNRAIFQLQRHEGQWAKGAGEVHREGIQGGTGAVTRVGSILSLQILPRKEGILLSAGTTLILCLLLQGPSRSPAPTKRQAALLSTPPYSRSWEFYGRGLAGLAASLFISVRRGSS